MERLAPGDPETVGPYRLLARLGAGGMGRVYLARPVGGSTVAVKVVHAELAADPQFRERFRREVAAAKAVSGPWTAPVVGADPEGAIPWLATAYVLGPSLTDAVGSHGPLPPRSLRALGAGLAEALYVIHSAGLAHRDLKPSNVLLAADGPRVIDFGIARAADGDRMTTTGMVVGSPGYMSPEQASGQVAGPAGDVFCLAAVMVFAATGRGPFDGASTTGMLYQIVHGEPDLTGLPSDLVAILQPCFAKDPAARSVAAQIASAFASQGAAAILGDGWLPTGLAGAIARHAAMVLQMDIPPQATRLDGPTTWPGVAGPAPETAAMRASVPGADVTGRRKTPAPGRRRFLLGSAAAGVVAVAGGVVAFALSEQHGKHATGGGVPAHQVDTLKPTPSVTSTSPSPLPSGVAPDPKWSVPVSTAIDTYPVVAGNRVLVRINDNFSTTTMTALDLYSGKHLWAYPGLLYLEDPPVVAGNSVLTLDSNNNLVMLSLASGEATRTIPAPGNALFLSVLAATPATAYILGSTNKNNTSIPYALFAVHLPTGKLLWRVTHGIGADLELRVTGKTLICGEDRDIVAVRSAATGAVLWHVGLTPGKHWMGNLAASVPLGLAITTRHSVTGWDLASGTRRWVVAGVNAQATCGQPAVSADGTTVYVVSNSKTGAVMGIDARNGAKKWADPFADYATHRPALAGGLLFVPSGGQVDFWAIDARTGDLRWSFKDTSASLSEWHLAGAPAAGLVVARHDNTVLALPAVA
jgi:outer membrane protein assembly factor BamB